MTTERQIELKELSVTELKSLAYDQLALSERATANLRAINEEIAGRQGKPVVTTPDGKEVEEKVTAKK